jgi:hypothetical protein
MRDLGMKVNQKKNRNCIQNNSLCFERQSAIRLEVCGEQKNHRLLYLIPLLTQGRTRMTKSRPRSDSKEPAQSDQLLDPKNSTMPEILNRGQRKFHWRSSLMTNTYASFARRENWIVNCERSSVKDLVSIHSLRRVKRGSFGKTSHTLKRCSTHSRGTGH